MRATLAMLLLLVAAGVAAAPAGAAPADDAAARRAYAAHLSRGGLGGATIQEQRHLDLGEFRFFGIVQPIVRPGASRFHRGAATAEGVVTERPGLFRKLLLAGPVDAVADRLQFLLADGGRSLLRPGQPAPNLRISPREWGLIAAPARQEAADGTVTFTTWFGSPPGFYPERLTVTAGPAGLPVLTWQGASQLLPPESRPGQAALEALASNDEATLRWAIGQVELLRNRQVVPRLCQLLGHASARVRFQAAVALQRLDDPRAADPALAALPGEKDWTVRYMLLRILGRLRVERAVPAVAAALDDPSSTDVRLDAVEALALIGSPAARQKLQAAVLGNSVPAVRKRATEALARLDARRFP